MSVQYWESITDDEAPASVVEAMESVFQANGQFDGGVATACGRSADDTIEFVVSVCGDMAFYVKGESIDSPIWYQRAAS